MSIHYKFKSALDFDTITFDGLHISVNDLKKAIIQQKRLGKTTDFELKITNAQTKEEYHDDGYLIPKNTSLIIARIPLANLPKKGWDQHQSQQHQVKSSSKAEKVVLDLYKMNGSEEEKIQAMMLQSSADYDPKAYQKIRGHSQTGEVPASYRCNKCKKSGHWIKNCPYSSKEHSEVKRTTGIPKSLREQDKLRLMEPNIVESPIPEVNEKIPDDLICSICKNIFTDPVMIPCCGSSFCDDCVRTSLLESEDNECPDCGEKGSSPGSLIPNRFLKNSVNAYKNEGGYNKRTEKRKATTKATPIIETVASAPDDVNVVVSTSPQPSSEQASNDKQSNEVGATIEAPKKPLPKKCSEKSSNDGHGSGGAQNEGQSATPDDSDFEDNITVTVPTTPTDNQFSVLKIKPTDRRNSRYLKPPGIENSPCSQAQVF